VLAFAAGSRREAAGDNAWGLPRSLIERTPLRTFVLYPLVVIASETLRRRQLQIASPQYLPLLAWGYLQYRLTGAYRQRQHAGGRGFDKPPDRLLRTGPYAYTRNPMYLGHLIFLLGLALRFPVAPRLAALAGEHPLVSLPRPDRRATAAGEVWREVRRVLCPRPALDSLHLNPARLAPVVSPVLRDDLYSPRLLPLPRRSAAVGSEHVAAFPAGQG
jgi:Phospholipid methyltransferase